MIGGTVPDLVIRDVSLFACVDESVREHVDVIARDGRISEIRATGQAVPPGMTVVEGSGHTLLPGLTDAHVHMALIGPSGDHGEGSWISHVLRVKDVIEATLHDGFTTVRDAGGLEPAFPRAASEGLIHGPRILPSGSVISQTGGHGDLREAHEAVHAGPSVPGLVARPEVVDGADAVRRIAREQLRRGATQIKIFASGGVLSPTDHWTHVQFGVAEIRAAVEVAEAWGTYVLAHCHSERALGQVIAAGVRSIEHGSQVNEAIAAEMRERGIFLVPTLQTLEEILKDESLSADQRSDMHQIVTGSQNAIRVAMEAGVVIGSGSDLVGPDQRGRGREIVLKAELMGTAAAILSATRDNARLFRMSERIGTVEPGKDADLVLVDGQPLDDIGLLGSGASIPLVVRGGVIVKDAKHLAQGESS
jgi:imidazolonepropionase-like amidohydrolase